MRLMTLSQRSQYDVFGCAYFLGSVGPKMCKGIFVGTTKTTADEVVGVLCWGDLLG